MGERLLCKQEVVGSIPSASSLVVRLRRCGRIGAAAAVWCHGECGLGLGLGGWITAVGRGLALGAWGARVGLRARGVLYGL